MTSRTSLHGGSLRPHIEFSRAFAHTHTLGRMQDHAGAQRQLLRCRMGSYQCSSTSRCSGKIITGSAANRGTATSHLSSGFVMPQHSRFDSCFVPETNIRSLYFRTYARGGVMTSARQYYIGVEFRMGDEITNETA